MTMTQIQLRAEATDCRSRGGVPEHASPTTTTTGRRHPDVALAQRDGSGRAATPCRVSEAWWSRRRSGSLRVSVGPAVLVVPSALTTGLTRARRCSVRSALLPRLEPPRPSGWKARVRRE